MSAGDGFRTDSGVSVGDVRHELADAEQQAIPTDRIIYHLGQAESQIRSDAPAGADADDIQRAVALTAAVRVVRSDKDAFVDSKGAADVSKSWDVEEWFSSLKKDAKDARGKITGEGRPSLHTVGGRVPRGQSRTDRRRY